MHILITRPHHQAEGTAAALEQLGHTSQSEPLLEIEMLVTEMPSGPFCGVILTSSNAPGIIERLGRHQDLLSLPVLTTGKASAAAAKNHGFITVDHVSGSALDLVSHIPEWMRKHALNGNLLYPCAETAAHNLHALLGSQNISCSHWPDYRAQPVSQFTPSSEQALRSNNFDAVLLYSRRTAHTFVKLMKHSGIAMKGLSAYVMSRDIYNALPEDLQAHAQFPETPSESDLMELIGR